MHSDSIQRWLTLAASALAAVASLWNLWLKYHEKSDRIKVVCGLIDPQISPGEFLSVVSLSDHPVRLADYGYVMRTGRLLSIPQLDADEYHDYQRITYGNVLLENRNASFETGMVLRDDPLGVYARTTGQFRPTVAFRNGTTLWTSSWVRMKIYRKSVYD